MHPFRSPRSTLLFAVLALAFAAPDALTAQSLASEHLSGLPFRTIGPAAMSGRIVDLAVVESDPDVFYVATSTGGVWKTTNRAVTLTPVFEHENTHSVGAITVHQRDTSIVWVGTGERASRQSSSWGDGVYKSTDGGTTWTHMGLSDSKHIGRIVLHPDNPDIVWVAAMGHLWGPNEERGLYKSTDGGRTWTRVLNVDRDTGVVDVALDPSDPNTLYASSYQRRRRPYGFNGGGPGSALWKSTDGGETWNRLTGSGMDNGLPTGEMGRIGISVYRSDPRIVYVSIEQGERYNASTAYEQRAAGIYRSEDRGATWTHMGDWNPRPMYASQILVDPSDDQRIYMVNTYSWSDDGGKTFTVPDQSLHGDDRLVWVDPTDSNHVMKADDGGLGLSWDRGVTWLYISDLPVSQFYRVTYDLNDPYRVYGGLQDNGSWGGPNQVFRSEGIINADWQRRGAWLRTPPEPTIMFKAIMLTSVAPEASCSKASAMVRCCCTPFRPTAIILCCTNARRSASRQIACSTINSSTVCGIVVGRIILLRMRLRMSRSSTSSGTQRTTFSKPVSATTLKQL